MKIIAFYLPQFHQIKENNQWWGKGFTEWTNTKSARPLFPGHYQPREPYQDFYYDLTIPSVRKWQVEIAKAYGIYGFCYYHYWFKGKRLLETPFNEVLKTGEPDFPFCLSWANEPWTKTWDGLDKHILMPQDYGGVSDWKEHFEYLLQAFKDKRYIRIDGKPLFIIYRPGHIPNCEKMLNYWDTLAQENGLKGIFFVETLNSFPIPHINRFDASIQFEPFYTIAHDSSSDINKTIHESGMLLNAWDYDKVWMYILKRSPPKKKTFPGAFVDWDNTARRKNSNSSIFIGSTPEKFTIYLSKQIHRTYALYNSEFLFINAWNEWAEGTYLEPDQKYGFSYLEAVQKAIARGMKAYKKDESF